MKRTVLMMIAAALLVSSCGINEFNKGLDQANELASSVMDAAEEMADEAASLAGSKTEQGAADDEAAQAAEGNETASDVASAMESIQQAASLATDQIKDSVESAITGTSQDDESYGILESSSDIGLTDTDGAGKNYTFLYGKEEFTAIYTPDNWKILDSYRVESEADMIIICQALIDEHPIHSKDLTGYRTADDMAYEWQIHNMAYAFLEDDDELKAHSRDVDFDPKDQGLTIEEFYKSRTGKDLDLKEFLGN